MFKIASVPTLLHPPDHFPRDSEFGFSHAGTKTAPRGSSACGEHWLLASRGFAGHRNSSLRANLF